MMINEPANKWQVQSLELEEVLAADVHQLPDTGALMADEEQSLNEYRTPAEKLLASHAFARSDLNYEIFCAHNDKALLSFVVEIMGNYQDAQDIVQETFEAASRNWQELQNLHEKQLQKWLRVTASRRAIDFSRRKKRRPVCSSFEEIAEIKLYAPAPEDTLEKDELVWYAFQQLSLRERMCLTHVAEGYNTKEIAEILQLKVRSVTSYLTRGRKKFEKIYNSLSKKAHRYKRSTE